MAKENLTQSCHPVNRDPLEAVLDALADRVVARLQRHVAALQPSPDDALDLDGANRSSRIGRATIARAAQKGELASEVRGRKVWIRRGDLEAWATTRTKARAGTIGAPPAEGQGDELDRALASGRLRAMRGGRR